MHTNDAAIILQHAHLPAACILETGLLLRQCSSQHLLLLLMLSNNCIERIPVCNDVFVVVVFKDTHCSKRSSCAQSCSCLIKLFYAEALAEG